MTHGRHIYAKAYDMENSTLCTYLHYSHALPYWKFVLWCCAECPYINIPNQETNKKYEKQHPQLGVTFISS